MNYFSNLVLNNNELSFELKNIRLAFANALRRILISDIEMTVIDYDSIEFINNTSMLHNNYLAKRLIFLPIIYSNQNISNITISLNKTNNTETMLDIYTNDFEIKDEENLIDPKDFFIDTTILFCKLKPTQNIILSAKLSSAIAKKNNSCYSHVNKSVLTYKIDEELVNKSNNIIDKEKYYYKNELDEPTIFIISIESLGIKSPYILIQDSINILEQKLINLNESFINNNKEKINIKLSKKLFEAFDFNIIDEDDTLGNIINSYLHINPLIKYSGYLIPHPRDNKLIISTSLKENNTEDNNKKIFLSTLEFLINKCKELSIEWNTATTAKSILKKTTLRRKKIQV